MLLIALFSSTAFALEDTYHETFDSMQDGATVNGADSWVVSTGSPDDAMIESGSTASGSGGALKLVGALTPVDVNRPAAYGDVSPTWIEYVVKPGLGADARDVPSGGIGAVNFSSTGTIMAADGTHWVSTGKTFTSDSWYRVAMKIDFTDHTYDLFISPASTPKTPFVADKENLGFIDPGVNSVSQFGFMGAYNASTTANSLVDEVIVHTIERLQIITSPMTVVKGYPSGLVTVQLQNSNSEPQTAWTDITIELRASAQTTEFSLSKDDWAPVSTITLPEGSRQVSFYFKDFVEGRPTLTANEYPDRGWTDAIQEEKIVNEGEYFGIETTTPQVAGKPFNVLIIARDGDGNPDPNYAGTVEIFPSYVSPVSGTKFLTPDSLTGFSNGSKEVLLTYPDVGIIKVTVRDSGDSSKIGYSGDILVLPEKLDVSAGSPQVVGKSFPVTVKALGTDGEVTPNYQGPVKLTVVSMNPTGNTAGVLNPAESTAGQFVNGVANIQTSYNHWGAAKIHAADSAYPDKEGESGVIAFAPRSLSVKVKQPSESREFFYVNENMEVVITIKGEDGLPVENFQGDVSITPSPSFSMQASYTFTEADKGQKILVVPAPAPGKYKLKVSDTPDGLDAESERFEVQDATIRVESASAPVGTTSVEVQLVDSKGKRIKENELTVTILFEEENENGSVFFSDLGKPIVFKNGVARVVIGDTEAETVTISAKSIYGLKTVSGKVTFGRAGAAGVGALMLRETKD